MKRIKVLLILLVVLSMTVGFLSGCNSHSAVEVPSQQPEQPSSNIPKGISWAKKYSGVVSFNSLQEMPDGGYILVGDTNSWDGSVISDIFVLKINSNGDKVWAKAFGQNNSYNGMPVVQTTNDGGYFVAGLTGAYVKGSGRFIIMKFNSKDEEEWAKAFGLGEKTIVSFPTAFSIQQTGDGGFVAASYAGRNCFVLKLDSKGNKEWLKVLNIPNFHSIKQTKDGGYVIAGGIGDHPLSVLVKLGKTGRVEWAKKYKVSKWGNEFSDVEQTKDGGYVAVLSEFGMDIGSNSTYSLVLKLDKDGDEEWRKVFGPCIVYHISSVKQTNDGGYIAAGWRTTANKHSDIIIKLGSKGNTEWAKLADRDDNFRVIQQTTDGGYIAAGMAVFKFNSMGNIENNNCLKDYKPETAVAPFEVKITDITKYIKTEPGPFFRSKLIEPSFKVPDVKVIPVNCTTEK